VLTTLASYGKVSEDRQAELIKRLANRPVATIEAEAQLEAVRQLLKV